MVLLTKISLFILFLAIFNMIREIVYFYICFKLQNKYKITNMRRLFLWSSFSYILTTIILGL